MSAARHVRPRLGLLALQVRLHVSLLARLVRLHVSLLARLVRLRLSLLAGLSALAGYAGCKQAADLGMLATACGAALVAAGCSALNQVQERREDALMARTQDRPLPAGRLRPAQAVGFALACLSLGAGLLAAQDVRTLAVCALVVAAYNGLYTPLKKITPFAVLAGGLAGAAGPVLGCLAAGGQAFAFKALAPAAALYLWQAPHFWLLAAAHSADYRRAGFAVAALPGRGRAWLARSWLGWLGAAMLLPAAFAMTHPVLRAASAALALGVAAAALTPGLSRMALAPVESRQARVRGENLNVRAAGRTRDAQAAGTNQVSPAADTNHPHQSTSRHHEEYTPAKRQGLGFAAVNACMLVFLSILVMDALLPRP